MLARFGLPCRVPMISEDLGLNRLLVDANELSKCVIWGDNEENHDVTFPATMCRDGMGNLG